MINSTMIIKTPLGIVLDDFDKIVSHRIVELKEDLYRCGYPRQRRFIESLIELNKMLKFEISILQGDDLTIN